MKIKPTINQIIVAFLAVAMIISLISFSSAQSAHFRIDDVVQQIKEQFPDVVPAGRRVSRHMILDNAIFKDKIENASISNEDLGASSVNSSQIIDSTIVSADIVDTTIVSADIADATIANADIAASAINDTQLSANALISGFDGDTTEVSTSSTTFVESHSNLSITINRPSAFIIWFSGESKVSAAANQTSIKCMVGTADALPSADLAFSGMGILDYQTYSAMFYNASVPAGTYTVTVQFRVTQLDAIAYLTDTGLSVLAIPK